MQKCVLKGYYEKEVKIWKNMDDSQKDTYKNLTLNSSFLTSYFGYDETEARMKVLEIQEIVSFFNYISQQKNPSLIDNENDDEKESSLYDKELLEGYETKDNQNKTLRFNVNIMKQWDKLREQDTFLKKTFKTEALNRTLLYAMEAMKKKSENL